MVIKYIQQQINEICADLKRDGKQIEHHKTALTKLEHFKETAEPVIHSVEKKTKLNSDHIHKLRDDCDKLLNVKKEKPVTVDLSGVNERIDDLNTKLGLIKSQLSKLSDQIKNFQPQKQQPTLSLVGVESEIEYIKKQLELLNK